MCNTSSMLLYAEQLKTAVSTAVVSDQLASEASVIFLDFLDFLDLFPADAPLCQWGSWDSL